MAFELVLEPDCGDGWLSLADADVAREPVLAGEPVVVGCGRRRARRPACRSTSGGWTQLLHSDVELPCPRCEYPLWLLLVEVVAQTAVICPSCRACVWLRDDAGSVQTAGAQVESMIDEALGGSFKGMF